MAWNHNKPYDLVSDRIMMVIMDTNNNSIQFFIIYVPSQQIQGQLQTQHS
jgi:hypothetical protein